MENRPDYILLLSEESLQKIISYKNELYSNTTEPGAYLKREIQKNVNTRLDEMSTEKFIQLLLFTKKPLIYAEIEIKGNGRDWNYKELQILGDLSVAMDVEIYDNGVWYTSDSNFRVHSNPLKGNLLFVPGPLLKRYFDLNEVTTENKIDQDRYNRLIERRFTPLLYYANEDAKKNGNRALITMPGVGCGAFADVFRGEMGEHLNKALQYILIRHANNFGHIACIYYDPFRECNNEEYQFGDLKYRVRPSVHNNFRSQLCEPKVYEESKDNFSDCKLFKVVAWDHVSYPGNDYFGGSRNTDDGVSGAATNSMKVITRIEGLYKNENYLPPRGKQDWEQVVHDNNITLLAKNNIKYLTSDGSLNSL